MIRIWADLWDKGMHAQHGAPDCRSAARALCESGYRVVLYPTGKKLSDTDVGVACDTDEEILAVVWLCPGIDDNGPRQ